MKKEEMFDVQEVSAIVRKVTVQETVWSLENIIKLLKQIEATDGFVGFQRIVFEVDEYPIIEYVSKLKDNK
jgi:hypothetical protein